MTIYMLYLGYNKKGKNMKTIFNIIAEITKAFCKDIKKVRQNRINF